LFHPFSSKQQNITNVLNTTLNKLNAKDPAVMKEISDRAGTIDPAMIENYRQQIIAQIECAISKATEEDDRVFTNIAGKPAKTLYSSLIADLLNDANLREGTQGVPRSTYCFRHTYATLRLQEGVDVYFLAEQMGTSVHMIEGHY
jgi:integrase